MDPLVTLMNGNGENEEKNAMNKKGHMRCQ